MFNAHGRGTRKNAFIVHRPKGDMRSSTDDSGLYYRDTSTNTVNIALPQRLSGTWSGTQQTPPKACLSPTLTRQAPRAVSNR